MFSQGSQNGIKKTDTIPSEEQCQTKIEECQSELSTESENPKGVPPRLWQKFKQLKERRETTCKKSTEKRIAKLKADVMNKVQQEIRQEDDIKILRAHGVSLTDVKGKSQGVKDGTKGSHLEVESGKKESNESVQPGTSSDGPGVNRNEDNWNAIKQYIGVNDHLKGAGLEQHGPQGKLEQQIDLSIKKGNVEEAEKLSDRIALQKFGTQVTEAINAKKFTEKRKKEEDTNKAKKKTKLSWGFDHKQKWETKSNM